MLLLRIFIELPTTKQGVHPGFYDPIMYFCKSHRF